MRLPARDIGPWARELIDECTSSREQRRAQIRLWKSYYYTGTSDGSQAAYNRCFPHCDRLASFLFSPVNLRFNLGFDLTEDPAWVAMAEACARYLNREYDSCNVDLEFGQCVNVALYKGCSLLKHVWGTNGLEGWPVHPEFFGVLREDIPDIDRQEAFVHTTYLTKSQFARTIVDHPEEVEILTKVKDQISSSGPDEELDADLFHQIIMGGTAPVSVTGSQNPTTGQVAVTTIPTPMLNAKLAKELIRVDELWVMDDEKQDYTTVTIAANDVVTEGKLQRRNLSGIPHEQPFTKVCPNEAPGYFWGTSEIAQIYKLQDRLNDQMRDLARLVKLKARPPRAFIGFAGMTQEKYKQLDRPSGFINEDTPVGKIETLAPEIPEQLFQMINNTISYFDDVAGFTPIMMGQGEQGVRAGVHAQTLARNSSPRMRDRALLLERQVTESGDFCFKMLQQKEAQVFDSEKKDKFLLSQLPKDIHVNVDSHTSSPAFQEDAEKLAFALAKAGAVSPEDLIRLTHPPHEDTLVLHAKQKAEAEQKLLAEHPELLSKGKGKGRR